MSIGPVVIVIVIVLARVGGWAREAAAFARQKPGDV